MGSRPRNPPITHEKTPKNTSKLAAAWPPKSTSATADQKGDGRTPCTCWRTASAGHPHGTPWHNWWDHGKMDVFVDGDGPTVGDLSEKWGVLWCFMVFYGVWHVWTCLNNPKNCLVFYQRGSFTMKNRANMDLTIKTRKLGMVRHGAASGQHCIELAWKCVFPIFGSPAAPESECCSVHLWEL